MKVILKQDVNKIGKKENFLKLPTVTAATT